MKSTEKEIKDLVRQKIMKSSLQNKKTTTFNSNNQ